jgi:NMD protein affecting ribosome stability and mRNA decay
LHHTTHLPYPVVAAALSFTPAIQTAFQNRAQKVKLVDAGFIWTEPHSKRLKVKLTIQDEVMNGTILQQGFVVEFVVENHMCLECNRANANPNSWTACVQVCADSRDR